MAVHHRHHVGACGVNLAMDEAFEIGGGRIVGNRPAVQMNRHQIVGGDKGGRHAARNDEARRIARLAGADMAETIDHAEVIENPIGIDQIFNQCRVGVCERTVRHHDSPARARTPSSRVRSSGVVGTIGRRWFSLGRRPMRIIIYFIGIGLVSKKIA